MHDLYNCTCPLCHPELVSGSFTHSLIHSFKNSELPTPNSKLDKEADRVAKLIYKGKLKTGDIDPKLTVLVAEKLKAAVMDGFGKTFNDVDYKSADEEMLLNIERNVYQFSAAKNYQQLKDMNNALKDENGVIRSFKDFRDIANKINYQYNTNWLNTEYNTAINSGTLAARWVDFEKNKDSMPLLEYVTAGDERVRESHRALNHTKKPIDDPFWNTYYPPNDYNCRCTVDQLTGGSETPADKTKHIEINPIFRVNLSKQGLAFPPEHPYYNGVPRSVLNKALTFIPEKEIISKTKDIEKIKKVRNEVREWAKKNIPINTGIVKNVDNKFIDKLTIRNSDVKSIISHPHDKAFEVYSSIPKLDELISKSKFIDWSYDNGNHPNVEKWYYYETEIAGKKSYINVMHTKQDEWRVYAITDNFDKKKLIKKK